MIKKATNNKAIIISAGGTGGHVFPAQAVAEKLHKEGYKLHLVCDERALKYCDGVFGDIEKTVIFSTSPRQNLSNRVLNLSLLLISTLKIMYKFCFKRPKVIISFGGYPAFPASLCAIIFGIPLFLHEQNSVLGQINRIFLPFADKLLISFPDVKKIKDKYRKKVILTGLPIRENLIKVLPEYNAKARRKITNLRILVIGGSQGAKLFSDVVPEAILNLEKSLQSMVHITHQVRKEYLDDTVDIYSKTNCKSNVKVFFDNIEELYNKHDLIISRAGASSVVEVLLFQKAAILIPFAKAKDNHQLYNAKYLSENSKVIMKEEGQFSAKWLASYIKDCIENPESIYEMEKSYKNQLRELHINSANRVFNEV
ncbi:UDP-N-acetylglucosamine--N-acetylmuramyl-(pentapeptide) pyrophosphoryl-undecaprenol N-acetylglucosamine transferase [Candidatus Bandiella numerosa]|uniref:UDP-N-acetylglucosamine--N-acetylmuramyl- (pentapeptide) pyrophosphoryl-undecaprenol N-acetylglucosamine transferase n=1 Tax=Candidatus Bandiella numerosa TaxID=2570586 RepID=UPI001F158972